MNGKSLEPLDADTLRDARLSVLGSARVLVTGGSDDDLVRLQTHSAELCLPEAMVFLCTLLRAQSDPVEILDEWTRAVLAESLQ